MPSVSTSDQQDGVNKVEQVDFWLTKGDGKGTQAIFLSPLPPPVLGLPFHTELKRLASGAFTSAFRGLEWSGQGHHDLLAVSPTPLRLLVRPAPTTSKQVLR